jgi:hypothetical protein
MFYAASASSLAEAATVLEFASDPRYDPFSPTANACAGGEATLTAIRIRPMLSGIAIHYFTCRKNAGTSKFHGQRERIA